MVKMHKIRVNINKISERILPKLDDELAQDVSESFKSLADLKKHIKKELQANTDSILRKITLESILKTLYEASPMEIPNSMIDEEYNSLVEQYNIDYEASETIDDKKQSIEDKKQYWISKARLRVGIKLICQKISEQEKIEVSDDEVKERMKKYFGDPDDKNDKESDPKDIQYKQFIESSIRNSLQQEHLFEHILKTVTVKNVTKMDYDEFMKHAEETPDTGLIS